MGHKIRIDELLKTTDHKRIKEYMRTDKPNRRKLYIEIYEFKDKEAIKKLPCKKEQKTDEAKTGTIEYEVTTKEIIQMKLKPLDRLLLQLMRIKQYEVDFNANHADLNRYLKSDGFLRYGTPLNEDISADFERWFLIVKRDGTIIGFFNVAWSSQVNGNRKVLKYGGDVTTIGINHGHETDANAFMNTIYEREELKKLPVICIEKSYGRLKLSREKWCTISPFHEGYLPKTVIDKYSRNEVLFNYYTAPPINDLSTSEEQQTYMSTFKENYKARYQRLHPLSLFGLDAVGTDRAKLEYQAAMEVLMNGELTREINTKHDTYNRHFESWKNNMEQSFTNAGQDFIDESVYGAVQGLSHARRNNAHLDNGSGDENSDNGEDSNPCEGCDEYATDYCRESCDHSPCRHCDNDCDCCDVAGNG